MTRAPHQHEHEQTTASSSSRGAPSGADALPRAHRDADEEALQAALRQSMEPDFMTQILQAESRGGGDGDGGGSAGQPATAVAQHLDGENDAHAEMTMAEEEEDSDDDLAEPIKREQDALDALTDDESDSDDANREHTLLNFPDVMLLDLLQYLDEDSIGHCICACQRLRHVAQSERVFEMLCRRVFPSQSPRVAHAVAQDRFALRKFATWFDMFAKRPHVRHNGFYCLKTFYLKKPELNMWSDIVPGTILQVTYYRYFAFQRDGSVLYAMLFRAPHEAAANVLQQRGKGVWRGHFQVDRDEVFVSVPTNHNVVEFRFRITSDERGRNVKLVLLQHYAFSEPNRTGWIDTYDTFEEELPYYRRWNLA